MSTHEHEDGIRRRRDALMNFFAVHESALRNPYAWARAAGIGYATLAQYMAGTRDKNLRADTYEKLAAGAARLIGVPVTVADLIGETPPPEPPPPPPPLSDEEARLDAIRREVTRLVGDLSEDELRRYRDYLRRDLRRQQRGGAD